MPKEPEDHKPKADEPFIWTAPDGRKVNLKPFDRLKFGLFRKSRHLDDEERTYLLIEAGTDEAGLDVIDDLDIREARGLFDDWVSASGVEPGKS